MTRPGRPLRRFALLALLAGAAALPAHAATARLASDPLLPGGAPPFFAEGDTAARFHYIANTPSRFAGDRRGSLRVLYDTTLPTARIGAPIGAVLSLDEDFRFGAVLTIRSAGFAADPNGFSQIAFGLWNAHTTGLGRTLFPSDAFDLVEFDWFANVTAFGGPFLSPSIFGGSVGANAFDNFAFQDAGCLAARGGKCGLRGNGPQRAAFFSMASQIRAATSAPPNFLSWRMPVGEVTLISVR